MFITKRDNTEVPFNDTKITIAIKKAFLAKGVSLEIASEESLRISQMVQHKLVKISHSDPYLHAIHIEKIQDLVEATLMETGHREIAKAYIQYRDDRAEMRKIQQLDTPDYFNGDTLGQFVYIRTYARWNEQKGRRETWPETVERYMKFMRSELTKKNTPLSEITYEEIQQSIVKMEVMPSMRLLQFAGPAAERCNACVYNCSYIAPTNTRDLADIIYLLMSGCGVGFSVEAHNVNQFHSIDPQNGDHAKDIVVPDSKEGWALSFMDAMNLWMRGIDVKLDYSLLRSSGAILKTTGGRSSGPQPLKDLMNFTRELIFSKPDQKLSTLNVHDIICKIGQIVVAGGVRRSALISLSDLSDHDIRDCKNGPIWNTNPQRYMSNNSAVYKQRPTDVQLMQEMLKLVEAGTGERGIFNREGAIAHMPMRRQQFLGDNTGNMGGNPCVTSDTWVQTIIGPVQVKDLIGRKVDLIVNGKVETMQSEGFFRTGDKQVFEVRSRRGYTLKLTSNHKLYKLVQDTEAGQCFNWVELSDLKPGDYIAISDHHKSNQEWKIYGDDSDGVRDGKDIQNTMPVEVSSSQYYKGLIEAIFDPNTLEQQFLRLDKPGLEKLRAIQRILIRLGKTSHIENDQVLRLETTTAIYDKIVEIKQLGIEPVYDVTVSNVHEFCANGIRAHNCGEILLQSHQFCNLTEVICRENDTLEDLKRKIRIASIIGTYQSSLCDYKFISEKWRKNQEDERLLGVSLTGIMDCKVLNSVDSIALNALKNHAISVNQQYAKFIRINASNAVTCIKPSGTVSQMTNSSSGIHARYAPYYIRRVRIASHDPLFKLMKDQGYPHHPEVGQDPQNPNTWVIEFPVASPKGAICTKDMTAIQQLEFWKVFKTVYTEHNPSVTISVKPNEWIAVQHWVSTNWDYVVGISFLPFAEHVYTLAPYEEITEEEYMKHPCRGKNINFALLQHYEKSDTTDLKRVVACSGTSCEL